MKPKKLIIGVLAMFFVFPSYAQELKTELLNLNGNHEKFSILLTIGGSLWGTTGAIESNMVSSGFDDRSAGGWFGGPKDHPFTQKSPVVDLDATYYFNERKGAGLNIAMAENIETHGYENVGIGNYLFLRSVLWSFSPYYSIRLHNNLNHYAIGLSLNIHYAHDSSAGENSPDQTNMMPGVYVAYSYRMLDRKRWFLSLKTNFRISPPSEIGPFIAEYPVDAQKSVFTPVKVNTAVINIGLGVGLHSRRQP
ncbi:hypothetical protein ACUNWD_02095 [Sunxiuqinia sp. A32]|uniref:hypothetical protein n=1 Tax=Sunxiuqinia sp. A32 TaxID=3461496 RepID=UPI00404556A3